MEVTVFGIIILFSEEHSSKALSKITVIPSLITAFGKQVEQLIQSSLFKPETKKNIKIKY